MEIRIYSPIEMEDMQKKANEIIKILPSDFEEAVDTLSFILNSMFDDKEDFILRFRSFRAKEKEEGDL